MLYQNGAFINLVWIDTPGKCQIYFLIGIFHYHDIFHNLFYINDYRGLFDWDSNSYLINIDNSVQQFF